ncbi:hypothetical protein, partial [Actinobacillus pleuropneumoniae]
CIMQLVEKRRKEQAAAEAATQWKTTDAAAAVQTTETTTVEAEGGHGMSIGQGVEDIDLEEERVDLETISQQLKRPCVPEKQV